MVTINFLIAFTFLFGWVDPVGIIIFGTVTYEKSRHIGALPEVVGKRDTVSIVTPIQPFIATTGTVVTVTTDHHGAGKSSRVYHRHFVDSTIDTTSPLSGQTIATTPCTKTVYQTQPMASGPTKTVYPLTTTSTVAVACGGCVLLTSNVGGLGPAVTFTATVTQNALATTTAWVCA